MKVLRFIKAVLVLVSMFLSFTACSEGQDSAAPIFDIAFSPEEGLIFNGEGGEQSINFSCNMDWG